jgi:hypothetical protein
MLRAARRPLLRRPNSALTVRTRMGRKVRLIYRSDDQF